MLREYSIFAFAALMMLAIVRKAHDIIWQETESQCKRKRVERKIRLSERERAAIVEAFQEVFEGGELRLFGSRTDSARRGGDIDLHVVPSSASQDLAHRRIDFLVRLKRAIGEQKIDLVIDRGNDRPIDRVAKREGVLLWRG